MSDQGVDWNAITKAHKLENVVGVKDPNNVIMCAKAAGAGGVEDFVSDLSENFLTRVRGFWELWWTLWERASATP